MENRSSPIDSPIKECVVANGQPCDILGLCHKVKVMEVLVVPDLPDNLILGMDFRRVMQVVPGMYSGSWHFCDECDPVIEPSVFLTTSDHRTQERNEVVDKAFTTPGEKLGYATLLNISSRQIIHPYIRDIILFQKQIKHK